MIGFSRPFCPRGLARRSEPSPGDELRARLRQFQTGDRQCARNGAVARPLTSASSADGVDARNCNEISLGALADEMHLCKAITLDSQAVGKEAKGTGKGSAALSKDTGLTKEANEVGKGAEVVGKDTGEGVAKGAEEVGKGAVKKTGEAHSN